MIQRVAIFLDIDGVLIQNQWDHSINAKINKHALSIWKKYKDLPIEPEHAKNLAFRRAAARCFSPDAMMQLRRLVQKVSNAVIIISSDWRKTFSTEDLKRYVFADHRWLSDKIVDKIPDEPGLPRGEQIAAWMRDHAQAWNIVNYGVFDDFDDGIEANHTGHFVHVDEGKLLTKDDVIRMKNILSQDATTRSEEERVNVAGSSG